VAVNGSRLKQLHLRAALISDALMYQLLYDVLGVAARTGRAAPLN
jgi:hypothetical protein